MTDNVTGADGAQWTRITDAVRLTGKSDRTLRRWVTSGRLPALRKGAALWVNLAGVATVPQPDAPASADADATLRAELAALRTQCDSLTEERDYLRAMLSQALAPQRTAIEPPPRQWRWPWQH